MNHVKHAAVDHTLTRCEREAPFRLAAPDSEPLDTPTRLQVEVIERDGVMHITERAIDSVLSDVAWAWRRAQQRGIAHDASGRDRGVESADARDASRSSAPR